MHRITTTWMAIGALIFHGRLHLPVQFGTTIDGHKDLLHPITSHASARFRKMFTWCYCIKIVMLALITSTVYQRWQLDSPNRTHMPGASHRTVIARPNVAVASKLAGSRATVEPHWNRSKIVCAIAQIDHPKRSRAARKHVHRNGSKVNGANARHHVERAAHRLETFAALKSRRMGTISFCNICLLFWLNYVYIFRI